MLPCAGMETSPLFWFSALLAAGLLLVIAEVFIPGGVAGVVGALAVLGAMGIGLVSFPPPWGFLSALSIVVFGGIFLLMWVQFFPRSRAGKRMALHSDGATFKSAAPPPDTLRGASGEALTALRPGGIALFEGKRYDVLADGGEWIAAGTPVRVTSIRDGHLLVRDAHSPS